MLLCELFYFPHPLTPPHIWCGSWSVCVYVCVCVYVIFLSFCFLFSLSYWLSYFCLVTIVCLVNHACKMLKAKNIKLVIVTSLFFLWAGECARSSMCTKGGRERRWGKKKKFILQKQIQFQTLSIPLILAGGSLLFCFDQMSRSTVKNMLVRDCIVC